MAIHQFINGDPDATLRFIDTHHDADPKRLAFEAAKTAGVDVDFVMRQVEGRKTARTKLPLWASTDGIVYPPRLALEQCSSEATAAYKARLTVGDSLADLTGGFGVDFSLMAQGKRRTVYVERQEQLCRLARHNLPLLGLKDAEVTCADSEEYIINMSPVDTIFVDPARRDIHGRRTYAIADCTPDVTRLLPAMLAKARRVVVKLSPMLDVSDTVRQLPGMSSLHILAVGGECKELVAVVDRDHHGDVEVCCRNDAEVFNYPFGAAPCPTPVWNGNGRPRFLMVPNAAVMKSGRFDLVAGRFGLQAVAEQSHLFVSDSLPAEFPGRTFTVDAISSLNKNELRQAMQGITRANIATRNFPLTPAELKKRLGTADGGDIYIFGTRDARGKSFIFITRKQDAR